MTAEAAERDDKDNLIAEVAAFCKLHKMADSTFGRLSVNNPAFLDRLRDADYSPLTKTVKRLRTWMKNYTKNNLRTMEELE